MAKKTHQTGKGNAPVPEGVKVETIYPAVGVADPTGMRTYAVKYRVHGFGPLHVVVDDFEKEHWQVHDVLACHARIVSEIAAIPGVTITNASNPVLPHLGEPLHTFNVEFTYQGHGPFSVWEPLSSCTGEHMVTKAKQLIGTIQKVAGLTVGGE